MTPEQFMDAALWFPESSETEPFGPNALVYRVTDKMFALLSPGGPETPARVNLKCDPGLALELREEFPAVTPGYHMNKKHWNSVWLDGSVPDDEVIEMLRHSYLQVAAGLRKVDRERVLAVLGEDAPPLPERRGSAAG